MASTNDNAGQYIVVARRYRPQGFDDLVGQGMVSQALKNAIDTDRVGHAYLFTGARGVGKTSTARILSKALNCQRGTSHTPCHQCDICEAIAAGDDVDVLEIDGASNRGIDEIRQLRSNVSVRPSRSRYKIYIIDEVHMLTKEAFNALLKTLEEPPEHVKFIFCTTDPEKIPITVLSRCQRFDFAPVGTEEIVSRLKFIVDSEGSSADIEALRLLARKAAGSVRDSQSLLEQLMSFTTERITVDAVHSMLGTAGTARLYGVARALAKAKPADAIRELDLAIGDGVDAGQLTEQLLGCIRDLLALSVGGGKELLLHSSESDFEELSEIAKSWGTQNLLAAAQIVDHALERMRMVTHSRVLLETALIRIAQLEDLQQLSDLISQLQSGTAPTGGQKKNDVQPRTVTQQLPTRSPNESHAMPGSASTPRNASNDSITKVGDEQTQLDSQNLPTPLHSAGDSPSTALEQPANRVDNTAKSVHTRIDPAQTARPASPGGNRTPAADASTFDQITDSATAESESHHDDGTPLENGNRREKEFTIEPVMASAATLDAHSLWRKTIEQLDGMAADAASHFVNAANSAPNRLVVTFPASYNSSKSFCERPERLSEIEQIVSKLAGTKLKLEFSIRADQAHAAPARPSVSARQREREISQRPYVQRAADLFSAEITGVSAPLRKDD